MKLRYSIFILALILALPVTAQKKKPTKGGTTQKKKTANGYFSTADEASIRADKMFWPFRVIIPVPEGSVLGSSAEYSGAISQHKRLCVFLDQRYNTRLISHDDTLALMVSDLKSKLRSLEGSGKIDNSEKACVANLAAMYNTVGEEDNFAKYRAMYLNIKMVQPVVQSAPVMEKQPVVEKAPPPQKTSKSELAERKRQRKLRAKMVLDSIADVNRIDAEDKLAAAREKAEAKRARKLAAKARLDSTAAVRRQEARDKIEAAKANIKEKPPRVLSLSEQIVQMDVKMFKAYNTQDIATFKSMFTTDLEWLQDDKGQLDYNTVVKTFEENFAKENKIRRTLVKGSREIFPLKDYGAIETGRHTFSHTEKGKLISKTFKYMMIWKKDGDQWKVSKVVSFGH